LNEKQLRKIRREKMREEHRKRRTAREVERKHQEKQLAEIEKADRARAGEVELMDSIVASARMSEEQVDTTAKAAEEQKKQQQRELKQLKELASGDSDGVKCEEVAAASTNATAVAVVAPSPASSHNSSRFQSRRQSLANNDAYAYAYAYGEHDDETSCDTSLLRQSGRTSVMQIIRDFESSKKDLTPGSSKLMTRNLHLDELLQQTTHFREMRTHRYKSEIVFPSQNRRSDVVFANANRLWSRCDVGVVWAACSPNDFSQILEPIIEKHGRLKLLLAVNQLAHLIFRCSCLATFLHSLQFPLLQCGACVETGRGVFQELVDLILSGIHVDDVRQFQRLFF
jgi:hypothetical protein